MDNSIGAQAVFSQEFAAQLTERFALPVLFWDERLTTKSARQFLISANVSRKKRKQVIDKMAAALILQMKAAANLWTIANNQAGN